MKTVSVNRKELVEAIGQVTHAGFPHQGWSWQVIFDPKDTQADAHVVLVNPDADEEVNYRLVNEEGVNVLQFADLPGFSWDGTAVRPDVDAGVGGAEPADVAFDDIKDLEHIRLPEDTRDFIAGRLRKHVRIGKDTFRVEYF